MKFIIHVGLHKTGSTSIQNFCGQNKIWLEANGIYYPSFEKESWFNHSIPLSLVFRGNHGIKNHSVLEVFDSNNSRAMGANNFLEYFKSEIKQQSAKNSILLSGEDISVFELDELNIFKEFLFSCGATEIEIILFIRHPIDFALSNAQELVGAGLYQFGEAIRLGNLQQARLKTEKFQEAFGKESVKVHSYDLAIKKGNGIIDYFFNLLGIHSVQPNTFNSNAAMGLEKCLILSALVKTHEKKVIRAISVLLDNAGSKIVANNQIHEYLAPLNQYDCEFLTTNHQISWENLVSISKPEIDLKVFDSYLKKLCNHDNTIIPATVIKSILEDISVLYPEIAQSISENYYALLRL